MRSPTARLFDAPHYIIDYFEHDDVGGTLVFTFTERTNRALDGTGFAGEFLLKNGFSVVAFKTDLDHWYQDLPSVAWDAVGAFLGSGGEKYERRACYGSSMGAYAAIAFSGKLGADEVVALSPQIDLHQPWDTRWVHSGAPADFTPVRSDHLRPGMRLVVAYDPMDADQAHVDLLAACCRDSVQLERVQVPASGHPVGYMLGEAGILKSLVLAAIRGEDLPAYRQILRDRRKHSYGYLFNLSRACSQRNKPRWAADLIRAALRLQPLDAEVHVQACQILERQDRRSEALLHAATAVALNPTHIHMIATLARVLQDLGQNQQTAYQLDRALAIKPGADFLRALRSAVPAG